jgi:hypothetical protein
MPRPINVRSPEITTRRDGTPVYRQIRAVEVTQGQKAYIELGILDHQGDPLSLAEFGFSVAPSLSSSSSSSEPIPGPSSSSDSSLSSATELPIVRFKVREAVGLCGNGIYSADAEIVSTEAGTVRVLVPECVRNVAGVYLGEFFVLDSAGDMVHSNQTYVVVNRGLFVEGSSRQGPPTMQEIRNHVRDSDISENFLRDNLNFDTPEIAESIVRPVLYFNDALPQNGTIYSTLNFPNRYFWLEGIIANLCQTITEYYRREHLPYQAAGMSVDDMRKFELYEREYMIRWKNFTTWVQSEKVRLNNDQAYGEAGSPYGYGY